MPQPSPGIAATAGRAVGLLGALVATSVGAGVIAAGVLVPGVAAAGSVAQGTVEIFDELPDELQEQPLSQQSRVLFADGSLMATFYYQNRVVVGLDRMAQPVKDAIVAIEDSRFYEHGGVDPEGMGRALAVNLAAGETRQGASTLTQQWIKNVLIEEAVSQLPSSATVEERQAAALDATESDGTAGYSRKLREVKLAIAAEQRFSKDEILERYLNIADFGDGQYGVETAAKHYFNKSAADLTVADSALLAGIVQQPGAYNPTRNPVDSTARRDVVLGTMLAQGKIDQATHDEAVATPLEAQLNVQPTPNGCAMAQGSAYFCDFAVRNLLNDPAFGADLAERRLALYRGGLTITTTLDPAKQRAAEETLNARVPNDGSDVAASIVSVEPGTGRVVAMAQNRAYATAADAGPQATSINYNVDMASGGGRGWQPGSNAKPFVLATWLAKGNTLNQTVNATQKTFANNTWRYGSCPGSAGGYTSRPWGPGNAGDGGGSSAMSVLQASYNSVNTAYAQMTNQLQLCDIQAMASALGVKRAFDGSPLTPNPSMVLGSEEVAPLAVANAYATFAAQGTYCTPLAVAGVTDADGQALPITPSTCTPRAIAPDVANGVTYALKETLVRGTARGQQLDGRVAAGKTGTTDESVATWFTGYTPNLSTSVWLGHSDRSYSLNGSTIAGRRYGTMYGGTLAAPTWKDYMNRALAGAPAPAFVDPPRSVIGVAPPPPRPTPSPSRPPSASPSPAPPDGQQPPPAPPAPPAPTQQAEVVDEGGQDDGDDDDQGSDDDRDRDEDEDEED